MLKFNGKSLRHGLALAVVAAVLGGCASQGGVENWKMTESRRAASGDEVAVSAVRLVIFRDGGSSAKASKPINVYIDERYQASLIGDAYTEHTLCPGEHRFAVAFEDVNNHYDTKQAGTALLITRDAVQYVRIVEGAGGEAEFAAVTAEQADESLKSLDYEQAHTISRVPSVNCAVP